MRDRATQPALDQLRQAFQPLQEQKCDREALYAIAMTLQEFLACSHDPTLHGVHHGLEVIMRAVAASLTPDPERMGGYLAEKLSVGVITVSSHHSERSPEFAKAWLESSERRG